VQDRDRALSRLLTLARYHLVQEPSCDGALPRSGDVAKKEPQAVYARLGFFELCLNLDFFWLGSGGCGGLGCRSVWSN
jgi:hypothetical protein